MNFFSGQFGNLENLLNGITQIFAKLNKFSYISPSIVYSAVPFNVKLLEIVANETDEIIIDLIVSAN